MMNRKSKGNTTVVLGGMAGSEGKGKIAGYLALRDNFQVAVANFMPNAGHTWVDENNEPHLVQQLPMAAVNPDIMLMISAGASIEKELLDAEIERFDAEHRLIIHPRVMMIEDRHREAEKQSLERISSTLKGCGHALADKVARNKGVKLAQDIEEYRDRGFLPPVELQAQAAQFGEALVNLSRVHGYNILIECPQGFDLDINHGLEYPYCTSRQTITSQALADAGLPPQMVDEVIAVIRPYPIRVGDAFSENGEKIGTSGEYNGSEEITWETVAERGGIPFSEISELTTVTKKLRRVFEPNWDRLKQMVAINGVTQIALNFANYIDYDILGASTEDRITPKVQAFMDIVLEQTGVPVTLIGTGAKDSEMIDLRSKYYISR